MRISNELQKGKAGEYLVCVDLILKGFVAFPSEQGLPYDVILNVDNKLLKIQVKTTDKARKVPQRNKETECYVFNIKRHGKNNKKIYTHEEVDVFALVALDTKEIIYLKNSEMPSTINFRVDSLKGTYYDEKGMTDYNNCKELYKVNKNQSCIARQLGISVATVNRYLKSNYKPFETNARYFNDFKKDAEWFKKL